MAVIRLSVAENPAELLLNAASGLFPLAAANDNNPWPTLSSWIILRQGGLRDDVHTLAASQGVAGWFDSPVCLFAEIASRWAPNSTPPLSHEERIALLTSILGKRGRGVFDKHGSSDAWAPAVDSLIRELIGEGVTPSDFRRAVQAKPTRDAFARQRDDALADIYEDWHLALAKTARSDGRDAFVRLAASIVADQTGFAERLAHRRNIRIVGLADLRGGWTGLLRALSASPAVDTIELHVTNHLDFPKDLPFELVASQNAARRERPNVALLEAPDIARETELVAVRVRALVDIGVHPSRIAVFYREARPGVDAMATALATLGLPVTARRRTALSTTGPARAISALLGGAIAQWSRHATLEVVEQPLLATGLAADVLDSAARLELVSDLDGWPDALRRLRQLCSSRDAGTLRARPHVPLPSTDRVDATIAAWGRWHTLVHDLERPRPMHAWFAWMHDTLSNADWGMRDALSSAPAGDTDAWRVDVRASEMLATLATDWQQALTSFADTHTNVSADAFRTRLALLLDADVITQPETSFGVVVTEALAGAWRPFEHVFVCGLASGTFPRRSSNNVLLPDAERRELFDAGLPLDAPGTWRDREETLFRVLYEAPSASLTLSWPAMDAEGREVVRSVYVDEVIDRLAAQLRTSDDTMDDETLLENAGVLIRVAPNEVRIPHFPVLPRVNTPHVEAHARQAAEREHTRTLEPSPYNGQILDASLIEHLRTKFDERFVWSATQLENVAKCTWSWFAARLLNLDERAEATDAVDASAAGTILHGALDHLFATARRERNEPAIYITTADRAWVHEQAAKSLDVAWNAAMATQWLGNPALHGIVRAELWSLLTGYLDFEMEFNEKSSNNRTNASKQIRTGAAEGEFEFNNVELTGAGIAFRLRGSIDRVDTGTDTRIENSESYFAAIDYKSSVGSTPGGGKASAWDDGVVLQVPLYAAVLAQLYPTRQLARMEYRTLRKPAVVHQLEFVGVQARANRPTELVHYEDAHAKMQSALDAAGERIRAVREGRLPTNPTTSCGCSPYCPALDVCRIPGGPVTTDYR